MKLRTITLGAVLFTLFVHSSALAQTFARSPSPAPAANSNAAQIEALIKKIDEQNAKIDMLSQQILKLEQQLSNSRPGVMIGEGAPATSTIAPAAQPAAAPANSNSYVVARGDTLTSIAKTHNVTVSDLQKYNHIENPLKLQIGQTITIPGSPTPSTTASPGE